MSHGHERPCSLAFCGHFAMQFTKCHTTAMSFSVLESLFPVQLQMPVPMSQATIQVFLCTARLRRQLCHFRIQIAVDGMVGGLVRFLVAGLWEDVRCIIESVFSTSYFLHDQPFPNAGNLQCQSSLLCDSFFFSGIGRDSHGPLYRVLFQV